jgi:hypothetical protein
MMNEQTELFMTDLKSICQKNKRAFALLLFVFCFNAPHAQYVREDTLDLPKNIIGVELNPLLTFALGDYNATNRFAAFYKRQLKDNKRLRIILSQENYAPSDLPVFDHYNSSARVISFNDSTIVYFNGSKQSKNYRVQAGFEWGDYSNRSAPFYAIDIFASLKKEDQLEYYSYYRKDSVTTNVTQTDGSIVQQLNIFQTFDSSETTLRRQNLSYAAGLALTAGWRFNLTSKLETAIWISPEVYVYVPFQSTDLLTDKVYKRSDFPHRVTSIDIKLRLLSVMLAYKF